MKIDKLLLETGGDIPFPPAQVTIHTPTLKEIALIGEKNFFIGCHFLIFNKDDLSTDDKIGLENKSNFDIFMSVMNNPQMAIHKTDALMVLAILFPQYRIKVNKEEILLQSENFSSSINKRNYEEFKMILEKIFCLKGEAEDEYNPADALAARIAEKIKKGKMKRNADKTQEEDYSIYAKYISILSIGLGIDKNTLSQYTVYQIRDEFQRFVMKENYDIYISAKLAGAKDLEEVENWMDDIHP